jgi:hypothetical protein
MVNITVSTGTSIFVKIEWTFNSFKQSGIRDPDLGSKKIIQELDPGPATMPRKRSKENGTGMFIDSAPDFWTPVMNYKK